MPCLWVECVQHAANKDVSMDEECPACGPCVYNMQPEIVCCEVSDPLPVGLLKFKYNNMKCGMC